MTLALSALLTLVGCDDDGEESTSTTSSETTSESATGGPATEGSTTEAADPCAEVFNAIVTDIDETLTLSDSEFTMQIADPTYDPVAREGSRDLIQGYADRGYRILYLTARSETVSLTGTGESAEDATRRWLEEHDFPLGDRTELQLSSSFVIGDTARDYKGQAIMDRTAAGWVFDYGYGNATSDIDGYELGGIDKAATFIIGEEAGTSGTVAIEGEDWLGHIDSHLPTVDTLCEPVAD